MCYLIDFDCFLYFTVYVIGITIITACSTSSRSSAHMSKIVWRLCMRSERKLFSPFLATLIEHCLYALTEFSSYLYFVVLLVAIVAGTWQKCKRSQWTHRLCNHRIRPENWVELISSEDEVCRAILMKLLCLSQIATIYRRKSFYVYKLIKTVLGWMSERTR